MEADLCGIDPGLFPRTLEWGHEGGAMPGPSGERKNISATHILKGVRAASRVTAAPRAPRRAGTRRRAQREVALIRPQCTARMVAPGRAIRPKVWITYYAFRADLCFVWQRNSALLLMMAAADPC
jgi:hypothetical protein